MSLLVDILKLIAGSKEGFSYWDIHKKLDVPQSSIRYHLRNLHNANILEKNGSKYGINKDLAEDTIIYKGGIIIPKDNDVLMLNCPYGKTCSECKIGKTEKTLVDPEKCKYLKEVRNYFKED